jgi:IS1 family transposase
MFALKYFMYLFGFRDQSEFSSMSDVLSKSFINRDVSEHLSGVYKDYSYRIEVKKINNVSIVCARVRDGEEQNKQSSKHWYAYKEVSGSVLSWRIN